MGDCTSKSFEKEKEQKQKDAKKKESISVPKGPKVIAKLSYPEINLTPIGDQSPDSGTIEKLKVKVPKSQRFTTFVWIEQPIIFYSNEITKLRPQQIKQKSFQQKLAWFRFNLEKKRISWQEGSETLKIDRWNILFSSFEKLKEINLFKEMKIDFNDEGTNDAGGLLREWMHLCIEEIMSPQVGIFSLCKTDETAYQIRWDKEHVDQIVSSYLEVLGLIIGKAIFQRISLSCSLDRTILRQLCGLPVHLCDVYSYDKDLYNSWASILKQKEVEALELDFCIMVTMEDGKSYEHQLIDKGKGVKVTDQNKKKFVEEIMYLYCVKKIEKYVKILKNSINKVIPPQLLTIFLPHEFQMLINGPNQIDLEDWRKNTNYDGYTENDDVIKWFWEEISQYGQEQLKNLLHYCTGSTRVPILGFKHLESNRGEVRNFTIRKIQLNQVNPFPKSHTCFNRLELPEYRNQEQLGNYIRIIMFEEFNHFGLD